MRTSQRRCTRTSVRRLLLHAVAGSFVLAAAAPALAGTPIQPQPRMGDPLAGLTPTELARFDIGRILYDTQITIGEGLGPVFNQQGCGSCHNGAGIIGGPGNQLVTRFGAQDKGVFDPLDIFGGSLLQAQAISPECQEVLPPEQTITAFRVTNGALGYGLIEAIPDADLEANELTPPPNVSGRAHMVEAVEAPGVPRVGRFGWKAQVPTMLTFSADAALQEMGLTNRFFDVENDPNGIRPPELGSPDFCDMVADPEDNTILGMGMEFIDRVTDFQRFLAAPPQTPRSGMTGETLFNTIGCNACHVASFTIPNDLGLEAAIRDRDIRPYSDFLLHDIGENADFIPQGDAGEREIRTPVLWGVRTRDPVWHNGSIGGGSFAGRMTTAILAHSSLNSEGNASVAAWSGLSTADKNAVIAFLDSLGRAEFDADGDNDVELDDFVAFSGCFTGPGPGPLPGGVFFTPDDPCAVSDIDQDGDIDHDDLDSFLLAFDGTPTDCNNNGTVDFSDIVDGTSDDLNGNGAPDECDCSSDCDGSGTVDVTDLLAVLAAWGVPGHACDANFDAVIDVNDLLKVLEQWGTACP